ncbi:MAG: leucine zipper domain-containing protein, partial [Casimicrobiaceae bacterium]|nr:leucine zipper domain-containing protein [Casimicrobiaceae bacterium]
MNIHKNARLTPKGRAHLIDRIQRFGLSQAASAAEVSVTTARKWLRRYRAEGAAGLADRSSRPKRCAPRADVSLIERASSARADSKGAPTMTSPTPWASGRSTVARALKA